MPIVAQLMQVDGDASSGGGDGDAKGTRPMVLAGPARPPPWSWCASTARHEFSDQANLRFAQSVYMEGVAGEAARREANRI